MIFDQKLTFKSHLQHVVKKGMMAAIALSGIAKSNWGARHKEVRQLFLSAIATRTDYAACIWHRPKSDNSSARSLQNKKLTTVQRHAMKAITGCYRTTATAALEIESDLDPPWLRLQSKALGSVIRMQTLSEKHPIHSYIREALRTCTAVISHRSVLKNILQQFPLATGKFERIEPYIRSPWWSLKAQVIIEQDKPSARAHHDQMEPESRALAIYTDGSGIDGKIGAAAFTTTQVAHQHLGSNTQFNVYTGELTAINLAVDIARHQQANECNIYTDSQAAIKALVNPKRQSGQQIIKMTLDNIDTAVTEEGLKLSIHWIPGHQDIAGNEEADGEAKNAARTPDLGDKFSHSPLKSSWKMAIKSLTKSLRKQRSGGRTAKHLQHILKHPKARAGQKYYNAAETRQIATTLAQMRTGHCSLNLYLHRFKKAASPYCLCQYQCETVHHYILECKKYKKERSWLQMKVGWHNMRLGILLGDPKVANHVAKYIEMTNRTECSQI